MEVTGLILGVFGAVGVVGQLLDGCLKAYKIFTTVSNLGRDSERLVCKIRIEEMRLQVWGRQCGVLDGRFEEALAATVGTPNEGLQALAEMVLRELYQTIMDLSKLQNRYGLKEESPGSVDRQFYKDNSDAQAMARNNAKKPGMKLKARWVINDKDKFGAFLDDLQFYNDKLEKLFPPAGIATLHRAWNNELLQTAGRDLGQLDLLESASSSLYPELSAFAQLKQLRINLDAKAPSKKTLLASEIKIPSWRLTQHDPENQSTRCRCVYQKPLEEMREESVFQEIHVFVEWVVFDALMTLDDRLDLHLRIDNLARMLHSSSNRHPDLNTVDCLGYTEDKDKSRYGLVYKLPPAVVVQTQIRTLEDFIGAIPVPELEVRFRLAHTLAVAVWSCHSLDWLHKTLCPRNIVFFDTPNDPESKEVGLSRPYLIGFDSSRPDHMDAMSIASKNLVGEELYRHPDSLGTHRQIYRKSFDIYSLGLLLLEIGLWRPLDLFHRGKYAQYSPSAFREKIIQSLIPTLGSKTGSNYRRVVQQCLCYEDGELSKPKVTSHQLMELVVNTLESLKV